MNMPMWSKAILCTAAIALAAGCSTIPVSSGLSVAPVVPKDNEQIIRDQLIILVDATGSEATRAFNYEKVLAQAFTGAMPDGTYESGINSFAGVSQSEWLRQPLAPFSRDAMVKGAASLYLLGFTTPLEGAIDGLTSEVSGKKGRGALLVISDGETNCGDHVLEACKGLKAAHGGEFCIYTVHVGYSDRGVPLMRDMAAVNGCGSYHDGETLNSPQAIDALVREIFLGPKPVPAPPPAPAPLVWNLKNIHFDNDSAVVAPLYDAQLDEAAGILKANPALRIALSGHTDFNASNGYNQKLSERRVASVKAAFAKRGIDAARFEGKAYGEEKPAVPNTTPENLHTNRRVELTPIQ